MVLQQGGKVVANTARWSIKQGGPYSKVILQERGPTARWSPYSKLILKQRGPTVEWSQYSKVFPNRVGPYSKMVSTARCSLYQGDPCSKVGGLPTGKYSVSRARWSLHQTGHYSKVVHSARQSP